MPELPDVTVYVEALERRAAGRRLERIRLHEPVRAAHGAAADRRGAGRALPGCGGSASASCSTLEGELFLVIHLMIAGPLALAGTPASQAAGRASRWRPSTSPTGTLLLTEAGTKKRASLHLVRGEAALAAFDPGGLELLDIDAASLRRRACGARTTRSSAPSPIRASSAASATPTPTRSCTARGCRR